MLRTFACVLLLAGGSALARPPRLTLLIVVDSLSSDSHLPPIAYSKAVKPVTLPPGLAMLSTTRLPTGSAMPTNTVGIGRDACRII